MSSESKYAGNIWKSHHITCKLLVWTDDWLVGTAYKKPIGLRAFIYLSKFSDVWKTADVRPLRNYRRNANDIWEQRSHRLLDKKETLWWQRRAENGEGRTMIGHENKSYKCSSTTSRQAVIKMQQQSIKACYKVRHYSHTVHTSHSIWYTHFFLFWKQQFAKEKSKSFESLSTNFRDRHLTQSSCIFQNLYWLTDSCICPFNRNWTF